MFINQSALIAANPPQLAYGLAVVDVDNDGEFELFVTGFGFKNRVLKWTGQHFTDIASEALSDPGKRALGVAACDFDGDGREEIYVLNSDTFAGRKEFGDRLFSFFDNRWFDLFSLPRNLEIVNQTAGRSVAAIDRKGSGKYGFFVANYGGPMALFELDPDGFLVDVASEAGVNLVTGGRSLLTGPLVSDRMDIFALNENGPNFFFRNRGDGTFEEIAGKLGLDDSFEHARGVAALDWGRGNNFSLVNGNWEGPHRLYERLGPEEFQDCAPVALSYATRNRTVIAADFDNDGYQEIFFNNIGQPNRLFGWREGKWLAIPCAEAVEPYGAGTGAAVADFNGDGLLELFIAHGESVLQPLSLYHSFPNDNGWLRVLPYTQAGAPARGALVKLSAGSRVQRRIVDAGSGYLCQMEPVAHFGLGVEKAVDWVEICWPDGAKLTIENPELCQLLKVPHPNPPKSSLLF